jgi:hypothetical protein
VLLRAQLEIAGQKKNCRAKPGALMKIEFHNLKI